MAKIIEFYGPPGVGKSTLAKLIRKDINKKDITILNFRDVKFLGYKKWFLEKNNNSSLKWNVIKFLFRMLPENRPLKIINSLPHILRPNFERDIINQFIIENSTLFNVLMDKINKIYYSPEKAKKILSWFQKDFFSYQIKKNFLDDEIVVLDSDQSSFCQHILATYSLLRVEKTSENYRKDIRELTNSISNLIDYSVYVIAEPQICLKRQKKRKWLVSGFEKLNEKKILEDLKKRIEHSNLIHHTLNGGGNKSIKIKNDKNIEIVKNDLITKLDNLL